MKVATFFIRLVIWVTITFIFLGALAFIFNGINKSIHGLGLLFEVFTSQSAPEGKAGLEILHSLDSFLSAFVFFVFGLGIAKLFLPDWQSENSVLPAWLQVKNFMELKLILWEAILTVLLVFFVTDIVQSAGNYSWSLLLIPASILLVSMSIFFIKKAK